MRHGLGSRGGVEGLEEEEEERKVRMRREEEGGQVSTCKRALLVESSCARCCKAVGVVSARVRGDAVCICSATSSNPALESCRRRKSHVGGHVLVVSSPSFHC